MRKILFGLGLLALVWSAYWAGGAWSLNREVAGWLEERRAEGWQAEASDVRVTGYPFAFTTDLETLALADPATGLAWQAPRFTFKQAAWRPTALTVVWPNNHVLRTPTARFDVTNDALIADLVTDARRNLPIATAKLHARTLTLEDDNGDTTTLANLTAHMQRMDETRYAITALAEEVALSAPVLQRLPVDLPQSLERASLDLEARFDRPWDLRALDERRPQPTEVSLRLLEVAWGTLSLRMSADLRMDNNGVPEGTLSVQAQNWRDMLAIAEASGTLSPFLVQQATEGLGFLARLSGNRDSLDVTLRMENGQVFVGIVPIGPAPRLRLR